MLKSLKIWLAGFCLIFICVSGVNAQTYPSRQVRLVIPFPPGGPADNIGRILAIKLSRILNQSVWIENKSGGGGIIGANAVVHAAPDGYSLLLLPSALVANNSLYSKPPFSISQDFLGVSGLAVFPLVLVAYPSLPVKTTQDLIALAKAKPGKLNYASAGTGGGAHLAAESFKVATGIDMVHVPYKGTGPAVIDTLGGHVSVMFASIPSVIGFIHAGKLNAIAVTSASRSSALPGIPTISEAGVHGYELVSWFGLAAPAGTPKAIVDQLSRAVGVVLKDPDFIEQVKNEGGETLGMASPQFNEFIKKETVHWEKVIKDTGVKLD